MNPATDLVACSEAVEHALPRASAALRLAVTGALRHEWSRASTTGKPLNGVVVQAMEREDADALVARHLRHALRRLRDEARARAEAFEQQLATLARAERRRARE